HHLRTIGVEHGGFIGRVFVTGAEIHQPATRAGLKVLAHLLAILCAPLARYDTDYQPMLGVQRDMIPIVALLGRARVLGAAVLFFLAHKGPLSAELPSARLRGNLPLTRHAGPGHARPPARRSVPPSRGLLPPGDRSYAPHSPRRYGRALTPPSPPASAPERGASLSVRRSGHDRGSNRAAPSACLCHSAYTPSDSPCPVCRRRCRPHSGSKIGRARPWLVLPNFSLLGPYPPCPGSVRADISLVFNHNRPPTKSTNTIETVGLPIGVAQSDTIYRDVSL